MGKIANEIKNLTNDSDMTLKELAQKIGEVQNKNYSLASLSQKLRKETISYKEIILISKILGYKITFVDILSKANKF
jgi:transcriptional regulator with XRE-family HTH domain